MGWPKGKKRKQSVEQPLAPPEVAESAAQEFVAEKRQMRMANPNWDRLKPKKASDYKMKAGNNWDDMKERDSNPDRFHIPMDRRPEGFALQWIAMEIYGERQKQQISKFFSEGGWTPVHSTDFDNLYKDMPQDTDGYVYDGGQMLCARPQEIHDLAKKRELAEARAQIAIKEQAFKGGQFDATGTDDPTAQAFNRTHGIKRSMERIEIPKE